MGTTRGTTTGRTPGGARPPRDGRPPAGRPSAPRDGRTPVGRPSATRTSGRPPATRPPARRPRPSRAVIWRRRTVALVVLLALVGGVVWGVSALVRTLTARAAEETTTTSGVEPAAGGETAGAAGDTDPEAAADTEPTGPVDPARCSPRDLDVTMTAEAGAGEPTTFALTLRNGGDAACLVDAGTASLVVTVHSGDDRVWSSGDCVAEPAERDLLLDAGDSTETAVRWDGTRSATGCPGGQGTAQPGTYRVSATLGGASLPAATTSFTLG